MDLAVPSFYSNHMSVLLNLGAPGSTRVQFASPQNYRTGSRPWGIATGDFNLDNRTDLVVTNIGDNSLSFFYGSSVVQPTVGPSSSTPSVALFGIVVAIIFGGLMLLVRQRNFFFFVSRD